MRIVVTAGPTREYIDAVRFISNPSSGRMGCAIAAAAAKVGHDVVLLLGRGANEPVKLPKSVEVERFDSVDELRRQVETHFAKCDALVMTAAVGDFRPEKRIEGKIARAGGPITVRLVPTEDVLAGLKSMKRPGQVVVAFAVEAGAPEQAAAKAMAEMKAKGADFVVVNPPSAMGAGESDACILSSGGVVEPWARRSKDDLAGRIVLLLEGTGEETRP